MIIFFKCGDRKAGPNIRDRLPTRKNAVALGQVYNRLALSFGAAPNYGTIIR